MKKGGQVEQFNWVLVIVSGAIILGFFSLFISQYIDLQEKKQEVQSVRFFGNVIELLEKVHLGDSGYSVRSSDREGLRFGYDADLSYYCVGDEAKIVIDKGEIASYTLGNQVVFTEERQKVNGVNAAITPWKYPFYVTNFIYLSDPKKSYILAYDSTTEELVSKIEEENSILFTSINYEKTRLNELKPKENSKVIIFSAEMPSSEQIGNIKIGTNADFAYLDSKKREIKFYDTNTGSWEEGINYYGDEMMLGSLFSENMKSYKCSTERALKRLKEVSILYVERTRLLKRIDPKQECNYQLIENSIAKLSRGEYNIVESLKEQNSQGPGCLWAY